MVSTTFRELGLSVEKLEYKTPTPIQAACIPLLLQNKDLMGLAQTGTGKTAAFALPLIQQFSEHPRKPLARQVRALILSPTRELAAQIHDNICAYAKGLNLSTAVIFGGVGYAPQFKKLAGGLDILPGGKKAPYPGSAGTAGTAGPHAHLHPDQARREPPGLLPDRKGPPGLRHPRRQEPGHA